MAKRKKKAPSLLFSVIIIIVAVLYSHFGGGFGDSVRGKQVVEGTIELHVIDVGQADAILIKAEEGNILFDAGDLDTKDKLKEYLVNVGVEKIEYAVFTHPHADHIGGADVVLQSFDVHNVIMPVTDDGDTPTTAVYRRMIAAIEADETINAIAAESGAEYSVGDVKLKILAPNADNYSELNDYSVVVRVDFGSTSFMLTGDAEEISEEQILQKYPVSELDCDFYKAAHHGARESNTSALLNAVSPSIIAISCGEGNSYGHPHAQAMERFSDTGAVIYRTDILGDLVFVSDGTTITKAE